MRNNGTDAGGGLALDGDTQIRGSTFTGNVAAGYFDFTGHDISSSAGTLTIENSTIDTQMID